MMGPAPKKQTAMMARPYTASMRIPAKKPCRTRSCLPAPRFWAIRVVMAWPMFCWGV